MDALSSRPLIIGVLYCAETIHTEEPCVKIMNRDKEVVGSIAMADEYIYKKVVPSVSRLYSNCIRLTPNP